MKTEQELKQALFNALCDLSAPPVDSEIEEIIRLCAPIVAGRVVSYLFEAVASDTQTQTFATKESRFDFLLGILVSLDTIRI